MGSKPASGELESDFKKAGAFPSGCNTKWTITNIGSTLGFWNSIKNQIVRKDVKDKSRAPHGFYKTRF